MAYDEGVKVGYKWYDAEMKPVLFPFGFGLSYTSFSYGELKVTQGERVMVSGGYGRVAAAISVPCGLVKMALPPTPSLQGTILFSTR